MEQNISIEQEQVSSIVKRMRAYAKLSQRDLSKKTGITQSDICKLEKGCANPSIKTLSKIAEGTGTKLTIDFIVDGEPSVFVEQTPLSQPVIERVSEMATILAQVIVDDDLEQVILYGSCARGDFTEDSDVDIALITKCDRDDAKEYSSRLAKASSIIMKKYNQIVNYVCLPAQEFLDKKSWYPYFQNIDKEGIILYGDRAV